MKKDLKEISFGVLLRKIRVEEAKIGLRKFADLVDLQPSNLSDIERNVKAPPANQDQINLICDALGLSMSDSRRELLFDLAAKGLKRIPADISETIKENPGVPVLVRTVANKQMTEAEIRELAKYIEENY